LPGGRRRIHFRLNLSEARLHSALLKELFQEAQGSRL
jgi:hypothetical protein